MNKDTVGTVFAIVFMFFTLFGAISFVMFVSRRINFDPSKIVYITATTTDIVKIYTPLADICNQSGGKMNHVEMTSRDPGLSYLGPSLYIRNGFDAACVKDGVSYDWDGSSFRTIDVKTLK